MIGGGPVVLAGPPSDPRGCSMWYATETFVSYSGGRRVYVRGDVVPDDVAVACLRLCRPSAPRLEPPAAKKRTPRKKAAKRVTGG